MVSARCSKVAAMRGDLIASQPPIPRPAAEGRTSTPDGVFWLYFMQNQILHESSTSPTIMFAARAGGVVHKSGCTFLRVKSRE